ncbi:MAG TPA: DUF2911 domain-containing protein [Candidatus Paceibacterota bacterium]|nr:DUF2911 domain-containing protein [Candidatus Paceibacterota bacterium]
MRFKTLVAALAIAGLCAFTVVAQTPKLEFPSPSPACTIKQRAGLTDIEVVYSRPSMKGREIFGKVVPFGAVWRTGANAATKITFSTSVKLNDVEVPAGSYALYTIPGEQEWTIILNKGVGQSGTQYDEKADVVRFKAIPAHIGTTIETLTIEFNHLRDDSAVLNLVWENTVVPIKIDLGVTAKLLPQIQAAMSAEGGQKPYFQAAAFYYDHDQDLQKAKEWVDEAIKQREAYYVVHLKAKILAKLGDKEGATKAANRSIELAKAANDRAYVKLNEDILASLK